MENNWNGFNFFDVYDLLFFVDVSLIINENHINNKSNKIFNNLQI